MWHVTDLCRLRCKTCFSQNFGKVGCLDKSSVDSSLDILSQLGVQKIDISGGEPLLLENLSYLCNKATEKGVYLTITTRGVGLEDNKNWIIRHWSLFSRVILSLDGSTPEQVDNYSSYPGTFAAFECLNKSLLDNGCNNIRINTVVNKQICDRHAASAMIQKIKELLPLEWCIIQPHPLNKKREYDLYSADNSEYQHFLSMAYQDFEGTSSTKVLGRNNDTYSTYWELLPDNKICRLSSDENYSFCKEFVQNNFALILSEIIKSDNSITI